MEPTSSKVKDEDTLFLPLAKWLQAQDLTSIQDTLTNAEITLDILINLSQHDLDQLVEELKLPILKKFKFKNAVSKLQTSTNNTMNVDDSVDNHRKIKIKQNMIQLDDNASVASSQTQLTTISSIAPSYCMNDPLVVIVGISEYDGWPNLAGISIDYKNIINTFTNKWFYKVFYQLTDGKNIYSNDNNILLTNNNYKLNWTGEEIEEFVEDARKHIVKNKHNGLLFVISSHGDTGRIMYDSECESFELDMLFSMFSAQASALLSTYKETSQESNWLLKIPKIFFLDMCRGQMKAKPSDVTTTTIERSNNEETDTLSKNSLQQPQQQQEKQDEQNTQNKNLNDISLHKNDTDTKNKNKTTENFSVKGISKEEAKLVAAQMSNFCKLFATPEGYAVGDGSQNGGMLLRNVCKCFNDKQFIRENFWSDIIVKIRNVAKRQATVIGNNDGLNLSFTQIAENEGTMETRLKFDIKYDSIPELSDEKNEEIYTPPKTTANIKTKIKTNTDEEKQNTVQEWEAEMDENFLPIDTPMGTYYRDRGNIKTKTNKAMTEKKKSDEIDIKREELERLIKEKSWTYAMEMCKEILDVTASQFEAVYHFYCGFIYEQGYHNYEKAEKYYKVALQREGENEKYIRYYARIVRKLERYVLYVCHNKLYVDFVV